MLILTFVIERSSLLLIYCLFALTHKLSIWQPSGCGRVDKTVVPGFESSDRLYVEKAQIMAKSPGLECSNCENSEFIGPGLIVWDQFYQFKLITLNCLQSLVQKRMRYRNGNRSCKLKLSTSLFQQKADDGDEERHRQQRRRRRSRQNVVYGVEINRICSKRVLQKWMRERMNEWKIIFKRLRHVFF